jgi:putative hydrolase of the HAD superfamily
MQPWSRGVDAVFFDAGETLLTPRVPIPTAYLDQAAALGVRIDRTSFFGHMRLCWSRLRDEVAHEASLQSSEELERAMWGRFTTAVAAPFPDLARHHGAWLEALIRWFDGTDAWDVAPGGRQLLQSLRHRGMRLGVISNWHGALHRILNHLDLSSCLDFVLVSAEHGYKKPHPSIFHAALQRAGVDPARAVHIGDSRRDDVDGAREVGIRPVLVHPDPPNPPLPAETHHVRHLKDLLAGEPLAVDPGEGR